MRPLTQALLCLSLSLSLAGPLPAADQIVLFPSGSASQLPVLRAGDLSLAGSIPVTQWQINSIADLLEFFDVNVESGALMGFGPARSVKGRLKEFRHMLVTAGKLYDKGNLEGGRQKLLAAGARTDGFPHRDGQLL